MELGDIQIRTTVDRDARKVTMRVSQPDGNGGREDGYAEFDVTPFEMTMLPDEAYTMPVRFNHDDE